MHKNSLESYKISWTSHCSKNECYLNEIYKSSGRLVSVKNQDLVPKYDVERCGVEIKNSVVFTEFGEGGVCGRPFNQTKSGHFG